jgi:hypothetical protein
MKGFNRHLATGRIVYESEGGHTATVTHTNTNKITLKAQMFNNSWTAAAFDPLCISFLIPTPPLSLK